MTTGVGKGIWYVSRMNIYHPNFANHQIRHQATIRMGSQPGFNIAWGLSVYIIRYCRSINVNNPLRLAN